MGKPHNNNKNLNRKEFPHKKTEESGKSMKRKKYKHEKPKPKELPTRSDREAMQNQLKEEKMANLKASKAKRTARNKMMTKKTKRGQPLMGDRIQYLLKKIQESQ